MTGTDGNFVCTQCGNRQAGEATCGRCGSDTIHDLRSRRTRDFLDEIEMRLRDTREGRIRAASVIGGMGLVFLLWFIPGYGDLRGSAYPGLPLFADQVIFMIAAALGIHFTLDRVFTKKKFPYVDGLPPPDRD
jgi:hypothetical protein